MTEHLISRGRRRIGFFSSQRRDNDRAQARRRGYAAALQATAGRTTRSWCSKPRSACAGL